MKICFFIMLLSLLTIPSFLHAANEPPPVNATSPGKINLNTAQASQLLHAVKGIGKKRADAIIKFRTDNHGFKSLDDLSNVPGLGKSFVKRNHAELDKVFIVK